MNESDAEQYFCGAEYFILGLNPISKIKAGIKQKIKELLSGISYEDTKQLEEVTKEIRNLITTKCDAETITKQAITEGMKTMVEDGMDKAVKGQTTLEEVIRVTKIAA